MLTSLNEKLQNFFSEEQHEARRIFHGRGHCYPGLEHLCFDWFKPVVLISAWQEVDNAEELKQLILAADSKNQIKSIVLQHRYLKQSPADTLYGEELDKIIVKAQGLRFEVHPGRRQNAGLFLDTGPLREWLKANSDGCNVLNLFAYTCALSVAALAGGGKSVTNVDMSKPSIEWGLQNHMLNGQGPMPIRSIPHNLFKSWARIKQFGPYDLVIIDPPTNQRGSFNAERNYKSVVKRMPELCNPGAIIIAALNSPFLGEDFLHDCMAENLPGSEFVEWIPPAVEFEETDADKRLKIALYKLPS
ncbi:class I SAM-dependent methyltransferase [Gammaproteobacteria bacterium]|jgi:23S rRNA (cytosine1962-C5)-methyltransferase|nr:class I SAM-dependent methyltransferase [Gammaproteobacteria bacterium]